MKKSASKLREVGTTNRTRIGDYEKAVNDKTGLIMKCTPAISASSALPKKRILYLWLLWGKAVAFRLWTIWAAAV